MQPSTTVALKVAWVAEKLPPLARSCMCGFATALSWHDAQIAAFGDVVQTDGTVRADVTIGSGYGHTVLINDAVRRDQHARLRVHHRVNPRPP